MSAVTEEDVTTYISSTQEDIGEPVHVLSESAEEVHEPTRDLCSDLFELLKAINEDVSSLFKLSALAKQTTPYDPYTIALATIDDTQVSDKEADEILIGDRFPRLNHTSHRWLRWRLAQSNHARRKYLKHCDASSSFGFAQVQDDMISHQVRQEHLLPQYLLSRQSDH